MRVITRQAQHSETLAGRAAAYIRMSTDKQVYSTVSQLERIKDYAASHALEVVQVYEDSGKSGLTIHGRPALSKLMDDVQSDHDFSTILVFDVSRWGRFQDIDESAYYEHHCRRNGVNVAYCAELFENDGSPFSVIVKMLKRAAAAEFSRELSAKVFAGQCRLIRMGYKTGGGAIYGLRRLLVGSDGVPICLLEQGEWKAIHTQRVILAPGPEHEIEIVNLIFKWYSEDGIGDRRIAQLLNSQNVPSNYPSGWTPDIIRCMLKNEKYIGNLIFNKLSFKLRKAAVRNPIEEWIRCDGAFPAIVPIELFRSAQSERARRYRRYTREELLATISKIYRQHGRISSTLIDQDEDAPTARLIARHFGTLFNAYNEAGIPSARNNDWLGTRNRTYSIKASLQSGLERLVESVGGTCQRLGIPNRLRLNETVLVAIRTINCRYEREYGYYRWRTLTPNALEVDFVVAAQLDRTNSQIIRYFLFSAADFSGTHISFTEETVGSLSKYSRGRLADFFGV